MLNGDWSVGKACPDVTLRLQLGFFTKTVPCVSLCHCVGFCKGFVNSGVELIIKHR